MYFKQKVEREVAEQEINNWLDIRKVYPSVREARKEDIDLMIEAIQFGVLTFDSDTKQLVQQILNPSEGADAPIVEMKYKHRLNDVMVTKYMHGESQTDGLARLVATIAALTDMSKGIIRGMESADRKLANAIALFFI